MSEKISIKCGGNLFYEVVAPALGSRDYEYTNKYDFETRERNGTLTLTRADAEEFLESWKDIYDFLTELKGELYI